MTEVGAGVSAIERRDEEIVAYADAMSDMFCAYLDHIARPQVRRTSTDVWSIARPTTS